MLLFCLVIVVGFLLCDVVVVFGGGGGGGGGEGVFCFYDVTFLEEEGSLFFHF